MTPTHEIFSTKMFLGTFLVRAVYFGVTSSLQNDDEGDDDGDEDDSNKPFLFEYSHWNGT